MTAAWRSLLLLLSVACGAEATCSPTTFYRNCWIRRFPGLLIDVDASARRGAQLLRIYQEDSAVKCSRTCCLSRNFSCNLAVFHYDTAQESVNCFHLHCPTLESCILKHRGNVILYNITAGVDPDLLVFGKYFSTVRAWPQLSSRLNSSEVHVSDKRHFNRPPMPPVLPRTMSSSPKPGKKFVSSTSDSHPPLSLSSSSTQSTSKSKSDAIIPVIPKQLPTILGSTLISPVVSRTTLRFIYRITATSPSGVTSTIISPTASLKATSPNHPILSSSATAGSSTFTTSTASTTADSSTFTTSTTSTTADSSTFTTPTSLRETTSSAYPVQITSTTPASSAYITSTALPKAAVSAQTLIPRPITASSSTQVGTHTPDAISSTDTSILSPITASFSSTTITVPPVITSLTSIISSTQFTTDRFISTTSTTSPSRSTSRPADQLTTRSQSSNTPGYRAPSLHIITATPVSTRPHSFPIGPANIDSGKQHPNDTKGYVNRSQTAADSEGNGVKPAPETPNWYEPAKALLVPVVVSTAILLGCCCSVLLAFNWRDKRKGLYRTSWGKKRGSMRLVKYVIVRESF